MSLNCELVKSKIDYNQLSFVPKLNQEVVDEIVKITLGYIDYLVPEPKWIVEFEKIIKLNLKEETKEIEKTFKSLQRIIQLCLNHEFKSSSLQCLFLPSERQINDLFIKATLKASPVQLKSLNSSMASLISAKCHLIQKQNNSSCLLLLGIDKEGDGNVAEISLILNKEILTEMVKSMSKIRNQLFDAT